MNDVLYCDLYVTIFLLMHSIKKFRLLFHSSKFQKIHNIFQDLHVRVVRLLKAIF